MKKISKIQASARGQECTLEIPGVCSFDPDMTVFCHTSFKYGSGKRNRPNERNGIYGCSNCHEAIGSWNNAYGMEIARALVRTAEARDRMGI